MLAVLNSYQGHLKHFRSYALLDRFLRNSPLKEYFYFTGGYRKAGIRSRFLIPIKIRTGEEKNPKLFLKPGGGLWIIAYIVKIAGAGIVNKHQYMYEMYAYETESTNI